MFEIKYLPSFYHDLDAIVDYIAFTIEAPQAAANLLDDLEKSIDRLKEFPFAHRFYRHLKTIPAEYRVMTVKNYLVFYIVRKKDVEIHRIIYKRRDLPQLIE